MKDPKFISCIDLARVDCLFDILNNVSGSGQA
jgi:hypothetical protein